MAGQVRDRGRQRRQRQGKWCRGLFRGVSTVDGAGKELARVHGSSRWLEGGADGGWRRRKAAETAGQKLGKNRGFARPNWGAPIQGVSWRPRRQSATTRFEGRVRSLGRSSEAEVGDGGRRNSRKRRWTETTPKQGIRAEAEVLGLLGGTWGGERRSEGVKRSEGSR